MSENHLMNTRTWRTTTTAVARRLLAGSIAILFAASCSNDRKNLTEPTKGLAHIPSLSTSSITNSSASFTTDKDDYAPGDTVRLSGSGWQPADVLAIHLTVDPQNHDPVDWSVTVDSLGKFRDSSYVVQESDAGTTLTITATDSANGESATATFTDNPCAATDINAQTISPSLLAFTETGTATRTYGVATTNQNPSGGQPGVIELCVFHDGAVSSALGSVLALYTGAVGAWSASTPTSDRIEFTRSDGDPNNIPLDGSTVNVGQATYSTQPTSETIVAHIYWPAQCPVGTNTCFKTLSRKPQAQDLTVTKTATASFKRAYAWTIKKSVDNSSVRTAGGAPGTFNYTVTVSHDKGTESDWQTTGTITVHNPNSFSVTLTGVTDLDGNGGNCTVSGNTTQTIAANGNSSGLTYTCTFNSNPGSGTNTAKATYPDIGSPNTSATGSATYDFSTVTPTLVDACVSVSDPLDLNSPRTFCVGNVGDPSFSFSYSQTVSDPAGTCTSHTNTSTFTTNTTGTTGSASQTVKDCQGADLTVTKDATPSFKRTYNWNIQKSVDKTLVEQIGGSATFNYTVVVNETGFIDSDWQVTGTIHVHNPNDWEAITANVTDAVNNGGSCTVTGGNNVSIPANGTVDLTYTCTYSSAPSPSSGTNTATATWDKTTYSTPTGSASGSSPFAFTTPTTRVNQTITVSDSFAGTLGTCKATDVTPFASCTFKYSRVITVPTNGCLPFTNTATIVETGLQSSVTVTVCGPAKTGALTIGFWKTTNGQNLIKTYCQNPALANYLKGLGAGSGPFSDAPTTSCNDLATYVSGILNGVSATDMNKMLKAQMLGTALDVWFSGPGWTSTKIGSIKPPSNFLSNNNLGTFNMDLKAVCPMVDNLSTGTATCQNNTPSTDAVAAGAVASSPMSMQAILNFASTTPAPFNGSTVSSVWYSGDRTKEEILKNIFDQFNNQLAFGSF
jgi:hypothetical protein